MKLHVQPSDSFASAREIEVDDAAGASVEALVEAVAAELGANVTEVFVWDEDFEEYALLEEIGDLADVLEAAGSAKVQVTVSAGGGGGASSPKPASCEPDGTAAAGGGGVAGGPRGAGGHPQRERRLGSQRRR